MTHPGYWSPAYCYGCERFPLEPSSIGSKGIEWCKGHEVMHAWNDRACVLYNRAKDETARRQIVKHLQEMEKQKDDHDPTTDDA